MYKSVPCISRPPHFGSKKISFSYFWVRICLKKLIFYLRIFFQGHSGYTKKKLICCELFFISVFDPCITRGRFFGPFWGCTRLTYTYMGKILQYLINYFTNYWTYPYHISITYTTVEPRLSGLVGTTRNSPDNWGSR